MHPQINAFIAQTHIKRGKKSTKANEKKKRKWLLNIDSQCAVFIYQPPLINTLKYVCISISIFVCVLYVPYIHELTT